MGKDVGQSVRELGEALQSFLYVGEPGVREAELRRWADKLWRAHPRVKRVLAEAGEPDEARKHLYSMMVERERAIRTRKLKVHPLEWAVIRDASSVMRNILSSRCERMAGFSALKCLWKLAHGRYGDMPRDLGPGFFEEFHRLLLAVQGRSGIYTEEAPKFTRMHGRAAGRERSRELDVLSERSEAYIDSYACGLDEDMVARRAANRRRILKALGAKSAQWDDHRWQLRHVIRDEDSLGRLVELSDEERAAIRLARENAIPFGVTPYYCSLMDRGTSRDDDHAIRAQVIPALSYVEGMIAHRREGMHSADFMLEADTSPEDLITRRYPRVAILKPYNTCAQICVYCQRNWEVRDVLCPGAMASKASLEAALGWFEGHDYVREVLVTGGDPFVMGDGTIEFILKRLARMKHIERVRFGTRTPVVLPQRITPKLVSILKKYHDPPRRSLTIVTHFEHAYEVTPEACEAVQRLRRIGLSVYNQMVFTLENSRRFEAVAARLALKRIGVDPYYTFMMKGKDETSYMRAPLARALQEQKEEARLMPGTTRTDETVYNVPRLGKNNIRAWQHHDLIMIMPDGGRMLEFHPWEKKISLADIYCDRDVPIYGYLMELARRGEDISEYESIWYYY